MNNIGSADLKLLKELYSNNFNEIEQKLKEHYPIQYLIGYVDFYNTKINVNENVLIPRFETELLIDKTIKFLKNKNYKTLIDICTGSGCIAISLKKHTDLIIDACDISDKALETAKQNAKQNNVAINYFKLDILKEIPIRKYDCIISNPPYVLKDEYTSPETKYEPGIALYANNNGLEFYERILKTAKDYLNDNGSIIFEIGATEGLKIKELALKYFPKAKVSIEKDYNNYDRFIFIEI